MAWDGFAHLSQSGESFCVGRRGWRRVLSLHQSIHRSDEDRNEVHWKLHPQLTSRNGLIYTLNWMFSFHFVMCSEMSGPVEAIPTGHHPGRCDGCSDLPCFQG